MRTFTLVTFSFLYWGCSASSTGEEGAAEPMASHSSAMLQEDEGESDAGVPGLELRIQKVGSEWKKVTEEESIQLERQRVGGREQAKAYFEAIQLRLQAAIQQEDLSGLRQLHQKIEDIVHGLGGIYRTNRSGGPGPMIEPDVSAHVEAIDIRIHYLRPSEELLQAAQQQIEAAQKL